MDPAAGQLHGSGLLSGSAAAAVAVTAGGLAAGWGTPPLTDDAEPEASAVTGPGRSSLSVGPSMTAGGAAGTLPSHPAAPELSRTDTAAVSSLGLGAEQGESLVEGVFGGLLRSDVTCLVSGRLVRGCAKCAARVGWGIGVELRCGWCLVHGLPPSVVQCAAHLPCQSISGS